MDIFHDFDIDAPPEEVYRAISTATGLNAWWSKKASGSPKEGGVYQLNFGPGYDWEATVRAAQPARIFELELTEADDDWVGTRVGFALTESNGGTRVRFHHMGWRGISEHFRQSSFCWAMYLRLLKRWIERAELIPYEERLDA